MNKLGTVPFFNAKPLIYPLEKNLVEHNFEIVYEVPSKLSKSLANKKVDLGLIPVAELINRNDYMVIKDISISSYGKVDSVVLVSKVSIEDIGTVALDSRSQSSSSLMKVILECFYKIKPKYIERIYDNNFFSGIDAGMVIGDSGLRKLYSKNSDYKIYDLGDLWTCNTGLPFVYAVFAVNRDVDLGDDLQSLYKSKSLGIKMADEIVKNEYEKLGVSEENCKKYITERIKYDLGENEVEAIIKFSNFLNDLGVSKKINRVNFYK